jgi:hypothetical protein
MPATTRKARSPRVVRRSPPPNLRRTRPSFADTLRLANRRAHEQANRRMGPVDEVKSIRAALQSGALPHPAWRWVPRMQRWAVGLLLLPFCWLTTWTLLTRFLHLTLERGFWQAAEFWYFSAGVLLMLGWLCTGLWRTPFLYLYVLGHELTHAIFVLCCRGRVGAIHISTEGGYITTNKTNLLIALSPYFVPFWSIVCLLAYLLAGLLTEIPPLGQRTLYGFLGLTWTFHMVWTLWMLPKDQPDLRENGTFFSLVLIYLGNLAVLVALLCLVDPSPARSAVEFGREWLDLLLRSFDRCMLWLENR